MHLLVKEFSDHHEIAIYDTAELYGEKGYFRIMQFSNGAVQGAMDLNEPKRIMFEYARAVVHLMESNHPSFEDVFIIGHGIGTLAGHFSDKHVKVAELNGKVVEFSKRYFGYTKDNVIVGDGRRILEGEEPRVYDYIILDAFNDKGTPLHLTSKEFFQITREKLDDSGSIIINVMGRGGNDRLISAIHTTLREEYAYTRSFALKSEGVRDMQNILITGRNKPIGFQERHMAGFTEIKLGEGHVITDSDSR